MPSSVVRSFGYDPGRRELRITFQSGRSYTYLDVPPEEHTGLKAAFAKGVYFNEYIRNRYRRDLNHAIGLFNLPCRHNNRALQSLTRQR